MMPRRNNHLKKAEQSFQTSRKDKKQSKVTNSIVPKQETNIHSKQVQSRIEYINFKEDSQFNINRLDLIFQRQPKQIQQKLMKLLISYNAVLQYNRNTDLFQVDLLLPFLNEEEKKEFVRQFLEIRRNKNTDNSEDKANSMVSMEQNKQYKKQSKGQSHQSKEIRKFSFNNKNNFSNEFEEEVENQSQEMMDEINYEQQRIEQEKKKFIIISNINNNKNQEYQHMEQDPFQNSNKLNLQKIEETINRRLKNAINIINRRNNREEKGKQNQNNSILISQEKRQEQSIIERLQQNSQFADSQRIDNKNWPYIKEDVVDTQQPSEERLPNRQYFDEYNLANNYHSQKFGQVIEEQQEDQQYEPLFNQQKKKKNQKVTTFQDYTKKYITLKQQKGTKNKNSAKNNKAYENPKVENQVNVPKNYFSYKEKEHVRKSDKSSQTKTQKKTEQKHNKNVQAQRKQRVRSRQSSSRSRSLSTHKQSPSKESMEIKQNLNEFFNQHRQNLQTFYSQIRNKIKVQPKSTQGSSHKAKQTQRQVAPQKSSQEFYILVLDDLQHEESQNSQAAQIPNSKQFKSQIIKEYKKEILINSKHLSSEDLIRYFRYLHSNAKKLYIKYLINKQK